MRRDAPTPRQAEILRDLARWPYDEDNYVMLHNLSNPNPHPRTVHDLIESGWVVWEDDPPSESTHVAMIAITAEGRAVVSDAQRITERDYTPPTEN